MTHEGDFDCCAVQLADAQAHAHLRDRLNQLDDPTTETVLTRLLNDHPDLHRAVLRAALDIDQDAVADALNETGA